MAAQTGTWQSAVNDLMYSMGVSATGANPELRIGGRNTSDINKPVPIILDGVLTTTAALREPVSVRMQTPSVVPVQAPKRFNEFLIGTAAIGAYAGYLFSGKKKNAAIGALAGALAGAVAGGVIGYAIDKR